MKSLESICNEISSLEYNSFSQYLNQLLTALGIPQVTIAKMLEHSHLQSEDKPVLLYKRATFIKNEDNEDRIDLYLPNLTTELLFLVGKDKLHIYNAKSLERKSILHSDLHKEIIYILPILFGEKKDIKSTEDFASLVNVLYNELSFCESNTKDSVLEFIFAIIYLAYGDYLLGGHLKNAVPQTYVENIPNPTNFVQEIIQSFYLKKPLSFSHTTPTWSVPAFNLSTMPTLSKKAFSCVVGIIHINWATVDVEIAGSLIYKFTSQDENNLYGHFTAAGNIDKVLLPLYVRNYENFLAEHSNDERALKKVKQEILSCSFLDPTDGPGCFLGRCLYHTKKLLRYIDLHTKRTPGPDNYPSFPNLKNFVGITSNNVSASLSRLVLWMSYWDEEPSDVISLERIVDTYTSINIHVADSLVVKWADLCPNCGRSFIVGSPTFKGNKVLSAKEKQKMEAVFGTKKLSSMDYSTAWLMLAAKYISNSSSCAALVLTNSVCQGEQVAEIWPRVYETGCKISFAYRSFKWINSSEGRTGVSVIIVGIVAKSNPQAPILFTEYGTYYQPDKIGPYLIADSDTIVSKRNKPLCSFLPPMPKGNMPYDNGNLLLTSAEKAKLLDDFPASAPYLKKIVGSNEFIKGIERWCIWIPACSLEDAKRVPEIARRIEAVKNFRLGSSDAGAHRLAQIPYRFREINETKTQTLVIPSVSSEKRPYVPIGFIGSDTIVSNLAFTIYDCPPWVFGVISSKMHMLWIRTVCGALETRIRYSSLLGYNTFPFPDISGEQQMEITRLTLDIIELRQRYYEKSLGDLYSSLPQDLKKAHDLLDRYIEYCYSEEPFESDYERLNYLFKLYEQYAGK